MLEADDFLLPILHELRARYRSSANAASIISEGLQKLDAARRLNGAEVAIGIAAMESFLADVLISTAQSSTELQEALILSSRALVRIEGAEHRSEKVKCLAVHTALLNGIAYKASGDRDEAFSVIERHSFRLAARLDIDWVQAIPLRRQLVLMSQSDIEFSELAQEAISYRIARPAEYYASLKRFFEYLLNRKKADLARAAFPAVRDAFVKAAPSMTPLAHVSFLKNAGQYLLLDGYPKKGVAILHQALRAAAQFNMHGQVRQINRLLNEANGGNPILEAFRV